MERWKPALLSALALLFTLIVEAAPRTRTVAHPPAPLAITGELTSADPLFVPSAGDEVGPRVAVGGGMALVVWNNGEKAARLDAAGRMLDPVPIEVLPRPALPRPALPMSDLVFHEGVFTFAFVAYSGDPYELRLARVTPAGEVSTRRIASVPLANLVTLAVNDRGELLIAAAAQGGIQTHFVGADGTHTLGPRLAGTNPKLASDGNDFLLLERASNSRVTRIGRDLTAGAPASIALTETRDLVWNGTDYVVLGQQTGSLRGVRVSAAGVAGETFLEVRIGTLAIVPSFSWTGSDYRLLWKQPVVFSGEERRFETRMARVGATGQLLEAGRVGDRVDNTGRQFPVGSTDIDGTLMVWGESTASGPKLVSRIFASAGPGMPVELLTRSANGQRQTAVAQNGAATIAVSVDTRTLLDAVSSRLSVTRLAADGTRPPGPGTVLYPDRNDQDSPDAAWNGTDTWIAWRELGAGILAARIDANGTLLDREPIAIDRGGDFGPSIACGPADCLVVWTDATSGIPRVRSLRLAPNGTRLDAGPADHGPGFAGDVVRAGGEYAFAKFTDGKLSIVRTGSGAVTLISASAEPSSSALAWNGSESLVVWKEGADLFHVRLGAAGNLLDAPRRLGTGVSPRAIWTGRRFLVIWLGANVEGARITRNGAIADAFPIGTGAETDPELAMRDDGTFVVSYTRVFPQWPYWGAPRTVIRLGRD